MRITQVVLGALALTFVSTGCGNKGEPAASADPGGKAAGKVGEAGQAAVGGATRAKAEVPVAASRGPEHAVFSLEDNRLLAHGVRKGGLYVPAGSAGYAKYMRFGLDKPTWKTRDEVDGKKVASMKGKAAGLWLPLTEAQAAGTTLAASVYSTVEQRLGARVNGKDVVVPITQGWNAVATTVPAGTFKAGENELLFFAGKAPVSVEWLQLGGTADSEPPRYDGKAGGKAHALALPDGSGMAWYVMVPPKGLVAGDLDDAACKVHVSLAPEKGKPIEGELHGRGSAVDVSAAAGAVARLELTASGCPTARLMHGALVVPGAAPDFKKGPRPKNVLLLVMDSLRADRIHAIYPGARPETPFIDELVAKGAVFTQFYVQGNETKCSHASIWTSLYPVNHKMIPPNSKIDPSWVTIEEVAKKAGLYASGASGNGYITPSRGFGDKWDAFRNHIHDGGGLRAEDIEQKGFETLAGKEAAPWFLYLGWIDTHVSWRAKEPWASKYGDPSYHGPFKVEASGQAMGDVALGKKTITDADKTQVIALYDSNVSYQDSRIRSIFDRLQKLGVLDQTMIVMTADHGDEQFEDGRVGHGASSRDSLAWVPAILYYPPMVPAGLVAEGAESVDIVPTVADALGVAPDPNWQGESLLPLVNGVGRGYPRLSMSSKYENGHAARIGTWKAYWSGGGKGSLYDMSKNSDEKDDVSAAHAMPLRMIADALWTLRLYNAAWKKSAWGNPANQRAAFPEAMGE